ncbi:hypothetical protein [Polyangium sp. y55x31]|uniref:hypothetical protein n=1 Tax=Polyangium sp. y55x31 TaxID=3042688 RepID=UPI002482BCD1|nr:hypothetical protein [Polyangium sp. y55x31]MDI1478077.1 hypothetical protein [Polyangium sp. y55x31]
MRLGSALAALLLVVSAAGCSKREAAVKIPSIQPSVVTSPAPAPAAPAPEKAPAMPGDIDPSLFSHVLVENGKTYVVLHANPDVDRWAQGAPILVSDDFPVVARREIEPSALPASLLRRTGASVRLYGPKGAVCEGKLGPISLISRVEPEYNVRQQWKGEDFDGTPIPPAKPEQIADEAWSMAEGGRSLVAELGDVQGDCKDAMFARDRDLPEARPFTVKDAPTTLATRAAAEMRNLAGYTEIDETYQFSGIQTPGVPWEHHNGATPTVKVFSGDGATYVWLDADAGEVCSEFRGKLTALWKLEGGAGKDARFVKLYEGADDFVPTTLVHLDRDASPSLLGYQSVLRKGPSGFAIRSVVVPYFLCPC